MHPHLRLWGFEMARSSIVFAAAVAVSAVLLSACSSSSGMDAAALGTSSAVVSSSSTSPSPTQSSSGDRGSSATSTSSSTSSSSPTSPSPSASSSNTSASSTSTTRSATSSGPAVLGTEDAGVDITLEKIFSAEPKGYWKQDRYNVSDKKQIYGMAVPISSCGESNAAQLELRLERGFKTLQFEVGQDNNSSSSDRVLVVQVVANGQQRDSQEVPFDQLAPFSVNVSDVNALKIKLFLKDTDSRGYCSNGGATVVVSGLKVES